MKHTAVAVIALLGAAAFTETISAETTADPMYAYAAFLGSNGETFSFSDLNGDGIPELALNGRIDYYFYTYLEGQVKSIYVNTFDTLEEVWPETGLLKFSRKGESYGSSFPTNKYYLFSGDNARLVASDADETIFWKPGNDEEIDRQEYEDILIPYKTGTSFVPFTEWVENTEENRDQLLAELSSLNDPKYYELFPQNWKIDDKNCDKFYKLMARYGYDLSHNGEYPRSESREWLFDFDQDGEDELLIWNGTEKEIHRWQLFDKREGEVFLIAEDCGDKPEGAENNLEIMRDGTVRDVFFRSLEGFVETWDNYIFFSDGTVNYLCSYEKRPDSGADTACDSDAVEEKYILNGENIEEERFKTLVDSFKTRDVQNPVDRLPEIHKYTNYEGLMSYAAVESKEKEEYEPDLQEEKNRGSGEDISEEDYEIEWKSEYLESAVRDDLGIYDRPIMHSDLLNVKELDLTYEGEVDLTFLGEMKNLKSLTLYLDAHFDTDTRFLRNLTKLESLEISNSGIIDMNDLANLQSLKKLYFGWEMILNVDSLTKLENLEELIFFTCGINDAEKLEDVCSMRNLKDLTFIYQNNIDYSFLKECTNLTSLTVCHGGIENIDMLSGLTELVRLDLGDNGIGDIKALGNLTNLEALDLSNNKISDISPLGSLVNLKELNLDFNNISDADVLDNLTNLTQVSMKENPAG